MPEVLGYVMFKTLMHKFSASLVGNKWTHTFVSKQSLNPIYKCVGGGFVFKK